MKEFESRNVEVMAVSIDSHFSHNAYRNTAVESGGIGPVNFSMIADINHNIAKAYDVEHPEAGVSFRGAFIIDNKGMVRSQIINDLPIGRDVDELLRIIDAVQYTDEHGEVCPAGWRKGKAAMTPSPDGVKEFLSSKTDEL
jgi:peroxiredoxin (alkyl hydroperoxide reductase subunit C)